MTRLIPGTLSMGTKSSFFLYLILLNGYLIRCVGQSSSIPVVTHKVPAKDLIMPAMALARRDRTQQE